jgi:ABC-2 type transport system ATP-binding protein
VIRVEALTKTYPGVEAVRDISFTVPAGEIFGFVGPNGAGKTTTMKVLATLLRPSSGGAWVDGVDVLQAPHLVRGKIGYMPDFFGVYDRLTVAEYLSFYANCYRVPRRRWAKLVADLLELINLPEKRDAQVDSLSRGMKQRLCLARALVHDPLVLILDEPASGLDPRARIEMRELLRELKSMGKTILISSHILPELAELCTSFGILDRGRMVASGPLEAIAGSGGILPRIRVRLGSDPNHAAYVVRQFPGVRDATLDDEGMEVTYEGGEPEAGMILAGLMSAGVRVTGFAPVEDNLEETFMRVTGAVPPA